VDVALAALAFAPGLAIGSFLNVVAARVPLKRSIVSPGSACMSCGQEVAWYDNVPVVSYLVLRGRCRGCATRIGAVYPAVELLTALLIAASFLAFGWSGRSFVAAFFCSVLVAISATDLSHRIVPNVIVLPATVIVLAAQTALEPSAEWALGAFGASLFLFLAALAYPKGMGMGDVKLAGVLGLYLGRAVAPSLLIALAAGVLVGAAIIARKGAAEGRRTAVPFGPFLALGAVAGLLAGDELVDAYLARF
jgi:leader peptidase (prepilin peptidase) / N-methyltransferase